MWFEKCQSLDVFSPETAEIIKIWKDTPGSKEKIWTKPLIDEKIYAVF